MVLLEAPPPALIRMATTNQAAKPACWDARMLTEAVLRSPAFSSGLTTRKHLILTLLEDASFRLSALHAEIMLRWRIASANPGPQNQALLADLGNNLQPKLLRAALTEDMSSSTRMLLAPEPLLHLLCATQKNEAGEELPAYPTRLSSWASFVVQLDVYQLSVMVSVLPATSRSPDPTKLPMDALNLADLKDAATGNPLPAFLFEYESPTAALADGQIHKGSTASSTAISPPMSTTSLPEHTYIMSGTEVRELASVGSVPILRRCSGLSGSNNLSASFFSPTISSRSSRQGVASSGEVPQEVASCWNDPEAAAKAAAAASADASKPATGLSAALLMQHGPGGQTADAQPGSTRRASKTSGGAGGGVSTSPVMSHRSSHDAQVQADAVVGSSYGSSQGVMTGQPHPGLVQYSTDAGSWHHHVGSLGAHQANWAPMSSSLPNNPARHGGLFSPAARLEPNDSAFQHLSPSSVMSDENEELTSQGVSADLETALEAIMGHDGSMPDSYPGASQQALQQHGAAIMRAARAGYAMPGAGGQGSYEAAAKALGKSFASVARMPSSDRLGGAGGGASMPGANPATVGSAPSASMAAYMKQATTHKVASYNHLGPDQTQNIVSLSADTLGASPSHMDMLLGGQMGSMHSAQSMGMPGYGQGWAGHDAGAMLGSSAPTMHGPAMMAAAARSIALQQQQQAAGQQHYLANAALVAAAAKEQAPPNLSMLQCMTNNNRLVNKLSLKTRAEVQQAVSQLAPGLKIEDLDDGVLFQLVRGRSEEEALAALRSMAAVEQLGSLQQLAAYMAHSQDAGAHVLGAQSMTPIRAAPSSMVSKGLLQKLPPRVLQRLEEVVSRCSYMDWKHFDAGVIKVMGQLSELSEADVLEELQLLEATDLSNVEYMPAYLNKRLNNRLWSRRKSQQQACP